MSRARGLRVEIQDRVALMVFDRPERRNAIDAATRQALAETMVELDADDRVRVVVVTGAGTAFCSGVDLKETSSTDGAAWIGNREALVAPLERFSKPILAAVNGPAVGGGFEVALCCELRVASPDAQFSLPESRVGSMPGSGGTQRIFEALPSAVAWKVLLTGGFIGAEEAHRLGLVSEIFDADVLVEEALNMARLIGEAAPLSLRAIKQAGRAAKTSEGPELERALWGLLSTTEDRAEGRAAFRDKRPPQFRGR